MIACLESVRSTSVRCLAKKLSAGTSPFHLWRKPLGDDTLEGCRTKDSDGQFSRECFQMARGCSEKAERTSCNGLTPMLR